MRYLVSGSTREVSGLSRIDGNADHLGFLLTPGNRNSVASVVAMGLPWAMDNGAYSGFDAERFTKRLADVAGQSGLLWVVCPDIVADAGLTIDLFGHWEPKLRAAGVPVAFVLQDGQDALELPPADCYFLGGSTEFKLSAAARDLSREAKARGAWLHMGRVNSLQRLWIAHGFGCDSVDGSSATRWGEKYIRQYPRWIRRIERESQLPTLF